MPKPKAKVGRPSKYTQNLADRICEQLAQGISLRTVCLADDVPSAQTIFTWMRTYPDFLEQYTRAKQESADAMAEDILDIADDGTNDWMDKRFGNRTKRVTDKEAIQRSHIRIETRKWLMAKTRPKKYSEKFQIDSTITKKLEDLTDEDLIAEAKARADRVNKILE